MAADRSMKVRVGYRTYRVEFCDDTEVEDDGNWGDCNRRTGLIRVSANNRPSDAAAETLLHELLHAMIADAGVEWDGEREEETCRVLAPRLAALVRDNPSMVDTVQGMLGRRGRHAPRGDVNDPSCA